MPWDTGADLVPFKVETDTNCATPNTYYLDADGDGYGGPVSVRSCYPPNSIPKDGAPRFLSGIWVTKSGDCYDDNPSVAPTQTIASTMAYSPPWLPFPLYDFNCDGMEAGPTQVWKSVAENCTLQGMSCVGGGGYGNGNRSASGYPGLNDLCGGAFQTCSRTADRCIEGSSVPAPCL
jgi:hypothetical protein